jgi:hypothetical protein
MVRPQPNRRLRDRSLLAWCPAVALPLVIMAGCSATAQSGPGATTGPTPRSTSGPTSTATTDPTAPSQPERFTPLIIKALTPDPIPVTGTDRKTHVVYELEVLNAAPRPVTITKVETLAGDPSGPVVSTIAGDQVVALSMIVGDYSLPPVPAKVVPPGRTVLLIMEATFADEKSVPASLVHRLTATFGAFEPNQGDFAKNNFPANSVEVGGVVAVGSGQPEVVGPPLSGDSWVAVNGCCGLSPHRGAMLPLGGRMNGSERYAIDWSKFDLKARPIVDLQAGTQATSKGDRTKNDSYFTFGQPALAVADATVVTVVDNLPEAPPGKFLTLPLADLGGNRVVLKIRDGVYVLYGHLMTGSVTVKPGDVVNRGQVIAKVGNSGNTSESHLHFHLMNGPEPLTATNIPWELDTFTFEGDVEPETVQTSAAGERSDELPLMYSAVGFPAVR